MNRRVHFFWVPYVAPEARPARRPVCTLGWISVSLCFTNRWLKYYFNTLKMATALLIKMWGGKWKVKILGFRLHIDKRVIEIKKKHISEYNG